MTLDIDAAYLANCFNITNTGKAWDAYLDLDNIEYKLVEGWMEKKEELFALIDKSRIIVEKTQALLIEKYDKKYDKNLN